MSVAARAPRPGPLDNADADAAGTLGRTFNVALAERVRDRISGYKGEYRKARQIRIAHGVEDTIARRVLLGFRDSIADVFGSNRDLFLSESNSE